MKNCSATLTNAKTQRRGEFYTLRETIEKEIEPYKPFLEGKRIICPADDPDRSAFSIYFREQFHELHLAQLISSHYINAQYDLFCPERTRHPVAEVVQADNTMRYTLKGDGDFLTHEVRGLIEGSDVVITNPPFALFPDLVAMLQQLKKSFLLLGHINAVTLNTVFPLILSGEMSLGYSITKGDVPFIVPDYYPKHNEHILPDGRTTVRLAGIRWFTNIPIQREYTNIPLTRAYNAHDYPVYDNYDAIEISRTEDIPYDYDGVMGVPITFLDRYNPKQFIIVGNEYTEKIRDIRCRINGKECYRRIFIKRR